MANSLDFKSVLDLSTLIKSKELSPVELLNHSISRIDALEKKLNTFASLDIDSAKQMAKASEERALKGSLLSELDGIPTSIKDLIAQKGHPQRFGSKTTPKTNLEIDAPSVERLRNAGAVLLGKSTTSEFGCKAVGDSPLTGITRNPWDLEKTPGGSSCGAAAQVASGMLPFAIGTDGGGSVRIPASLTGLFGIKAQFGRVPVYPVSATPTLAHVGPLCRNVTDAAMVLKVISGHDRKDPFSVSQNVPDYIGATKEDSKLKILVSSTLGYANPDQEVLRVFNTTVKYIEKLGHEVENNEKIMDEDPVELWNAEFYAGVGTKLKAVIESKPELIDPPILEVLKIAISQKMENYYNSVFNRYILREKMRLLFEKYDLLVTPTLPCTAFEAGQGVPKQFPDRNIVSWVYYTYPFNLTGQPAASMNVGFDKNNLPVGMQIISKINCENKIFSFAKQLENKLAITDVKPGN
ncbi:MAG: amidase [alpha proteobacterium HIMB114]|jgi:aspartyl-tRNA(Asn)/glutamyl-tRNA(Gln) amidotransferase subunit A|nr:MAG: amidase [alpha proteobacterium HIMB114]|tara:strand:+ start:10781 stop:12178 length:1398 start_codon:yes stop_codon:yes gene_type:complete